MAVIMLMAILVICKLKVQVTSVVTWSCNVSDKC